jgi:hypothetical protein
VVIEAERERGVAPPGPPARELAIALIYMNERVMYTSLSGEQPAVGEADVIEVLITIWLKAIYGEAPTPS